MSARRNLLGVNAACDRPGRDNEVDNAFTECRRQLVQLDEILHAVEHLTVATGRPVHLLEDGRHVAKDRRVQKRCTHQQQSTDSSLCRRIAETFAS